jgi:hypothetical protein
LYKTLFLVEQDDIRQDGNGYEEGLKVSGRPMFITHERLRLVMEE